MDALKCKIIEKATTLSNAKDALAAQLTFVMYGLLVVEQWRRWVARSLTLVPFSGTQTGMSWESSKTSFNVNEYVSVCPPVVLETCIQTPAVGLLAQEIHGRVSETLGEHGQRRPAEANEEEPQNKRQRSIKTKTQATMTTKCESVSEREKYYLEQIENLQKEKMSLRKVRLFIF